MRKQDLVVNGRYNWVGQPERLRYVGWSRGWFQFEKVGEPGVVWCEVRAECLDAIEPTIEQQ